MYFAGIAVKYDELYRRRLEDRARAGGHGSDPSRVVMEVDRSLLAQAELAWQQQGDRLTTGAGKGNGADKGKGKGAWGHGSWLHKAREWDAKGTF